MTGPEVDCMACIANAMAGIPHVDDAAWSLGNGVTHGLYVSEPREGSPSRFTLCDFTMQPNGYWRSRHGHLIPKPYDGTDRVVTRTITPGGVTHDTTPDGNNTSCGIPLVHGTPWWRAPTRAGVTCLSCAERKNAGDPGKSP